MRSTFFGLETARRGLFAFQQALDTTGHNISNANTPGYSRQVVRLSETTPFSPPSFSRPSMAGMIGTGVEVASIERMRDEFLDTEVRNESQSLGRWETRRDLLAEVELIYTEPSDSGIRSSLDAMWTSLQNLANHPEDGEARSVVKQTAAAFADTVRHTYDQLSELRKSIDQSISVKVDDINRIASQIANLNDQIMKANTAGLNANDFKDQRQLLIKDLSKLVNIGVTEGARGDVMVTVAGTPLVDLNQARSIEAVADPLNGNLVNLQWSDTGDPVYVSNGQLQGLLEMRDTVVVDYMSQLDSFASAIISQVNTQHGLGRDLSGNPGIAFFTGADASDITFNPALMANGSLIAASQSGQPGDGSNALAIANLNKQKLMGGGTLTFEEYFRATISQLGVESQDAEKRTENSDALIGHLETQAESVSGVSLDEEMTNMIKYQHGYNATARVITTMDEMIDTIINRMGTVGR